MGHAQQAAPTPAHGGDQELIAAVVRGDERALAALYDQFSALVLAIALRITGDRVVAEEVLQDVFLAVWRTAGGFRPGGSVAAWMIGIARHRAIDATRSRRFRAALREQSLEPGMELATSGTTEEQVERRLTTVRVRAAIERLAPAQREALELAYYGGLSQGEIARQMGAPIGTTKTRLRLGLLHLRRELDAAGL
jgi:RNA polymerase sigma-70 factor (ECF subfamily)